jgi:ABC-type Mn2+/Zn2+ transport system permease subunit
VRLVLALLAAIGGLHLVCMKPFVFVSFDPETASTLGLRTRLWTILLYTSLGATIALTIHVVGIMVVFALLVLAPVAGLLLGRRLPSVFLISVVTALVAVVAGLLLSFHADFPSGPAIVACLGGIVVAARVLKRGNT